MLDEVATSVEGLLHFWEIHLLPQNVRFATSHCGATCGRGVGAPMGGSGELLGFVMLSLNKVPLGAQ